MAFFVVSLLNGLSYGLLLFMLSAGLTLIFSLMGVLNFAHASFYMLGAYAGYSLSGVLGFWAALVLAPLLVAALGALFERHCLRRVHGRGHVPEMLMTFGLSYVVLEVVQLLWGRAPLAFDPPEPLRGTAFTLVHGADDGLRLVWGQAAADVCGAAGAACSQFPATRAAIALTALAMLLGMWLLLVRTRTGHVLQAALTHPQMVQALGHDVPRVFMLVFAAGAGLAALAGVLGGATFVTEPAMAAAVGPMIFVVVVAGGLGSLAGAFAASLLIGVVQTFAVGINQSLGDLAAALGLPLAVRAGGGWSDLTVAQIAPMLPYLLLTLVLLARPRGLLGASEG
ncbi:MAG: branched-chain amino acid ABC transporter permease [Burkholderiaceae bacterium]|jgi:branched-chain amino acid transport system permease protein|nr:branched-chain amino acid ABC transporter permease [Burkholderiaceae bacterium]